MDSTIWRMYGMIKERKMIMIACFTETVEQITEALNSIHEQEYQSFLDECEATLRAGNSIIVSGLGKNVPICDKFVGSMLSMGLRANFLHTNSAVHGDMGMVQEGDLVIMLTKSGGTGESIYLAELLQERGTNLWLISFSRSSLLARKIRKGVYLDLNSEGDPWNIMPNNSTTLNLIVLQSVAVEMAKRLGISLGDFKRNHPGGMIGQQLREKVAVTHEHYL